MGFMRQLLITSTEVAWERAQSLWIEGLVMKNEFFVYNLKVEFLVIGGQYFQFIKITHFIGILKLNYNSFFRDLLSCLLLLGVLTSSNKCKFILFLFADLFLTCWFMIKARRCKKILYTTREMKNQRSDFQLQPPVEHTRMEN
jgi:hypothetical protein